VLVADTVNQLHDVLLQLPSAMRRRLEQATRAETDRLNYRRACRKANQLINASRSDHYRQRIDEAGSDSRQRWKIVSQLLHSKDTDKTRTDDEHWNLCFTFGHYFVDKT